MLTSALPSPPLQLPGIKRMSQALDTYCPISMWFKRSSGEAELGGGGRKGSLRGAHRLLLKPGEQWRAAFRDALSHAPTPRHRLRSAEPGKPTQAGRPIAGSAGRKWGDLTAHVPDQTGLSSAGREGGHAQEEEEKRETKRNTYHQGLSSPLRLWTLTPSCCRDSGTRHKTPGGMWEQLPKCTKQREGTQLSPTWRQAEGINRTGVILNND